MTPRQIMILFGPPGAGKVSQCVFFVVYDCAIFLFGSCDSIACWSAHAMDGCRQQTNVLLECTFHFVTAHFTAFCCIFKTCFGVSQ